MFNRMNSSLLFFLFQNANLNSFLKKSPTFGALSLCITIQRENQCKTCVISWVVLHHVVIGCAITAKKSINSVHLLPDDLTGKTIEFFTIGKSDTSIRSDRNKMQFFKEKLQFRIQI